MMGRFRPARLIVLVTASALSFVSGRWLMPPAPSAEGGGYQQDRLFEDVVSAIHTHFIDSLGEGELYERAAGALVGSLHDPYAELLLDASYREYQRQVKGIEADLGPEVEGPTESGVHVPSASRGLMVEREVGYVVLHRMSEGAGGELRREVDRLVGEGITSLILDLRSNPGGLIREGVAVASLFLHPGDTVATSIGRSPEHSKVYLAGESGGWNRLRLALLVNRGTASSAEVVAGALQDHDRAVVVGTASYGKGVLQTTYPLGKDIAIKLTTARWFTPSGRTVQRLPLDTLPAQSFLIPPSRPRTFQTDGGRAIADASGIMPDLLVLALPRSEGDLLLMTAGDEMDRFQSKNDRQLQGALRILRGAHTQREVIAAATQ
jgi:Peptidase family S41